MNNKEESTMKLRKTIMAAVAAAMLTVGAAGASFAAGLGTIDAAALLQNHPKYAKTMATWQADVKSAQDDFQRDLKKTNDQKAQQALVEKYNNKLNQQRIALFQPLEQDILAKTQAVQKEKGLDYVVLNGSVVVGQGQDITKDVAARLK
ncbi:outer membrane protein [Megasphaera sp. MJR8396C]|nr:outer membrane protein [Megasphaera sp. MJR8396C]